MSLYSEQRGNLLSTITTFEHFALARN
jgi:hypothetical protein